MSNYKKITILDTSVGTLNLGDEIIIDSVKRELKTIFFENTMFLTAPTHEKIGRHTHKLLNMSNYAFVGGTNLLRSKHNIFKGSQWKINLLDSFKFNNVLLMGVGWGSYESEATLPTKLLYRNALKGDLLHSVRDNYTKQKLISLGIKNVINTGCPTTWQLTKQHCAEIPRTKAKSVVFTLTDYNKDITRDKELIHILLKNYEKVYFWIQGSNDYQYINSLTNSVILIEPSLEKFDELLDSNEDIDYVGTRLHAGIRAMQKKRRSLIIGIDNRALEKQKDFNLNVIKREKINELEGFIKGDIITNVHLDEGAIKKWKKQFFKG